MKFNNYCLLILGIFDRDEVINLLGKTTEGEVNYTERANMFLATFVSVLSPNEINNIFNGEGRSVIVFKVKPEDVSVKLSNETKQKELFDNIFDKLDMVEELTDSYGSMIDRDIVEEEHLNNEESIAKMTKREREALGDEIIDKGIENLTKEDKELLTLLSSFG